MSKKLTKKKPRPRTPIAVEVPKQDLKALIRRLSHVETTQALAVVPPAAAGPTATMELTEAPQLGQLGLVELKLTPEEEKVLSEPVSPDMLSIKPSGQPYASHPHYTRWLNRAFGRTGWALVPQTKPMLNGKTVACFYTLYIHGKPAASAMGEQEYYGGSGGNREQTYGDAVEATVASALRRCCKRLGIGLELWDKPFLNRFVRDHCMRVPVEKFDYKTRERKTVYLWRRKDDPALPGERQGRQLEDEGTFEPTDRTQLEEEPDYSHSEERRPPAPARPEERRPQAGTNTRTGDVISEPQARRLFAIIRNSGRNEEVVRDWLERRVGSSHIHDVKKRDYDFICRAIESARQLPEKD